MNEKDYQIIQKKISKQLKARRADREYSIRELATLAGMGSTYLSNLENNKIPKPSLKTILNLCDILEILPSELFREIDKLPPFDGNPSED